MNEPTFVEAARMLATRVLRDRGATHESRIASAFRLVTARFPDPAEMTVLLDGLDHHLTRFQDDREGATGLIGVGEHPLDPALDPAELAAYTAMTSLILNLDEAITRE